MFDINCVTLSVMIPVLLFYANVVVEYLPYKDISVCSRDIDKGNCIEVMYDIRPSFSLNVQHIITP